jgi:chitin synthase
MRQTYPYSQEFEGHLEKVYRENVTIYGQIYPFSVAQTFFKDNGLNLTNDYQNTDLSGIFDGDTSGACAPYDANQPTSSLGSCRVNDPYGGWIQQNDSKCLSLKSLQQFYTSTASLSYDWVDLQPDGTDMLGKAPLLVYGDTVLNISKYLDGNTEYFGATGDTILRNAIGNDASYSLMNNAQMKAAIPCLLARYQAGVLSTENGGCIASGIIMNVMIAVIIAVVAIRYMMAVIFQWFIASSLVKPGGRSGFLSWRSKAGGNDDPANHVRAPTNMYNAGGSNNASVSSFSNTDGSPTASAVDLKPGVDIVSTKLYTIMQVTCYSEGEESMRTTMDSLAQTTYSKKHKVFMVIADGLITGSGESRSTPDIVIDMMDLDPTMADPKPCSYLAIADGEKQLNMAKVYAGHYKGVACLLIVKCGTPAEASSPKPGNRGKRDSQMILMAFFQRVLFNDRLSELDYEMFWKMTWLTKGVTPDKFETVLMVDADTKVLPDALTYMVAAMVNDITIMGLCGETRIANKRTSCKCTQPYLNAFSQPYLYLLFFRGHGHSSV